MIAPLYCPNCGAPLHPGPDRGLIICLYCNSAIRIQMAAQPQATVESSIAADSMAEVKQLLLAGHQQEALSLYQRRTGADMADAESAIADLSRQVSLDIIRSQTLTPYGILAVFMVALLLAVSAAAGLLGRLHPLLAIGLAGFAILNLLFFAPSIRATIAFLGASIAPATVLKLAPVGTITMRGKSVHTFKFLLEVRPETGAPFQAELLVPVRNESLLRAQPGAVLRVKYLPHDPARMIFYRGGSSD